MSSQAVVDLKAESVEKLADGVEKTLRVILMATGAMTLGELDSETPGLARSIASSLIASGVVKLDDCPHDWEWVGEYSRGSIDVTIHRCTLCKEERHRDE